MCSKCLKDINFIRFHEFSCLGMVQRKLRKPLAVLQSWKVVSYGQAKFLLEEKLPRAFAIGKELGIAFRLDRRIVHTAGCSEIPWSQVHAMKTGPCACHMAGRLGRSQFYTKVLFLFRYHLSDLNPWPRSIRYRMIFMISELSEHLRRIQGFAQRRWTSTRRCCWHNGTTWRSALLS